MVHLWLILKARLAVDPSLACTVSPYVADELPDWSIDMCDNPARFIVARNVDDMLTQE